MFLDKIEKASSEIQRTHERLDKLKMQKGGMTFGKQGLMLKDKSKDVAQDCTLSLRIQKVTGIPKDKFSKELLEKAYVRVLLDDDTFNTGFAQVVPDDEGDVE